MGVPLHVCKRRWEWAAIILLAAGCACAAGGIAFRISLNQSLANELDSTCVTPGDSKFCDMPLAVERGRKAQLLIRAGADPRTHSSFKRSTLMLALNCNDTVWAEELIHRGVPVDEADASGVTPLMIAAANGNLRMARKLVARGASVNRHDGFERSALWHAVWNGSLPIVRFLLSSGADASRTDNFGNSVLSLAARSGRSDLLRLLLDQRSAKASALNWALCAAAIQGHADAARLLLRNGADPLAHSKHGNRTPAQWAYAYHHSGLARALSVSHASMAR